MPPRFNAIKSGLLAQIEPNQSPATGGVSQLGQPLGASSGISSGVGQADS